MAEMTWADALKESEDPASRDGNLWAQCFAEADGDESKAKAAYIKAKVGAKPAAPSAAPAFTPAPSTPRTGRGYCPLCGADCDLDARYCGSCKTNGISPTTIKPFIHPNTQQAASAPQVFKAAKSRGIYVILGIIFGMFGIHNFYVGRFKRGTLQLLSTVLLGWFVVGLFITAFWVIFDLFTVTTDGAGDQLS